MVIHGMGRVVTIKFVVLPEPEHRMIASSLADEGAGRIRRPLEIRVFGRVRRSAEFIKRPSSSHVGHHDLLGRLLVRCWLIPE